MRRVKRGKIYFEIFLIVGLCLLAFVSVVQFISFAQRSRTRVDNQSGFATNVFSYTPPSPGYGSKDSSNKLSHMSRMQIVSGIQAKLRARTRVQQEVRELERALAKLIRENSVTPDESNSLFRNELYARRVGSIIEHARKDGVIPLKNNGQYHSKATFESVANNVSGVGPQAAGSAGLHSDSNTFNDAGDYASDQDQGTDAGNHSDVPLKYDSQRSFHSELDYSQKQQNIIRKRKSRSQLEVDTVSSSDDFRYKLFGDNVNVSRGDHVAESAAERSRSMSTRSRPGACPLVPYSLAGQVPGIDLKADLNINDIVSRHSDVLEGGEWNPPYCLARHRVAIIIPYRDRWSHLKTLLNYLIPILKKQHIHFRIFIVEQFGEDTFNKGRIMNAAFREAVKLFDFDCVTFHDVDLVPEDDRNMYTCSDQPKHMSIAIDKFSYILPYQGLVGGVLTFLREHFQMVNGYSNMYWGWGAEDDDMTTRILHKGFRIYRPPTNIARYKMVKHGQRKISEATVRMKLLRSAARRSKLEGLNNVMYKVLFTHKEKLFTHFMVDIGKP